MYKIFDNKAYIVTAYAVISSNFESLQPHQNIPKQSSTLSMETFTRIGIPSVLSKLSEIYKKNTPFPFNALHR